jgi:transposase InsO family protein
MILDLFSRFVVGWAVSAVNDRHLTIKALEMALKRRCPDIGLLHHSDQGCTYASEDDQRLLASRSIVCSMSRRTTLVLIGNGGQVRKGSHAAFESLLTPIRAIQSPPVGARGGRNRLQPHERCSDHPQESVRGPD